MNRTTFFGVNAKKAKLACVLIAAIIALSFALVGCNNNEDGGDTPVSYTVTFDSQGGSAVESVTVTSGNPVRRPETPTREGYFLVGWFKDGVGSQEWFFDVDSVTSDITLYALWQEVPSPDVKPEPTLSLEYALEGEAYTVTGVGEETVIVIPSVYEGLPVTKIQGEYGNGAFARKAITEVYIPDSIVEIGQNTFNNCSDLTTVHIEESSELATIGRNAFSGNSSLTSIYLPVGVETIGDSAFNNCGALESIVVAENNRVYSSAGNALIELASNTLIRGTNATVIPSFVTAIERAAFRRAAITEMNIPANVTAIGNYAFDDCQNLAKINVSADNQSFASLDGVLYSKDMTEIVTVPDGIAGDIALPAALAEIPNSAFDGRAGLSSVYIPRGALNYIRLNSFRGTTLTVRFEGTEEEWNAIRKHDSWGGAALSVTFGASESGPNEGADGVLVVYFSCSNRTQGVAEYVAAATGGVLVEITPEVAYTAADLNYNNSSSRSQTERREDARPTISNVTYGLIDMSDYQSVFIGYPIWNGYEPMIIRTFIEHYNGLPNKTVYTFSTSSSSGGTTANGSVVGRLSDTAVAGGNLHSTSSQLSSAESRVNDWIDGLGLTASEKSVENMKVRMIVNGSELYITLQSKNPHEKKRAELNQTNEDRMPKYTACKG